MTLFPVNDKELVILITESMQRPVDIAFGSGGAALKWEDGEPIPWYIERLGEIRGVLHENGSGI